VSTGHLVPEHGKPLPDGAEPSFRPPLRLPGKPDQTFSPKDYMALTDQSRDPTLLGKTWGLTEEPINTISKGGFQLFKVEYAATQLIPYTTGDKLGPRPQLVARYDRARAARGLLEEVTVLEIMDGGKYRTICIAGPRSRLSHEEASHAEFFAFRREYVRVLIGKRDEAERQFVAIHERDRELKAFLDKRKARARQKRTGKREVSAKPITLADLRAKEKERLGEALQGEGPVDQAASTATGSKPKRGGARPSRSSTHVEHSAKKDLGDALGGATGFRSDEAE
jgi:hypothetical protein